MTFSNYQTLVLVVLLLLCADGGVQAKSKSALSKTASKPQFPTSLPKKKLNAGKILRAKRALDQRLNKADARKPRLSKTRKDKFGGDVGALITEDYLQDYDDDEQGFSGLLSGWLPQGSQWQPLMRPFAVQRDLQKISKNSGSLSSVTNLLPGMQPKPPIPKIFHQIYLEGADALAEAEAAAAESPHHLAAVRAEWRAACRRLHPQWEFRLWNLTAIENLLQDRYPWFWPTFQAYPQQIFKVDAARPFLLDTFGGLYIDLDVECLQPVDIFLEEHQLVLQLEDGGSKSLVNSAIAGVPGLFFWRVWQETIFQRAEQTLRPRWWLERRDAAVLTVLNATGPWALRAAFLQFSRDFGLLHTSYVGAWRINETDVMVFPLGTWFVPCLWNDGKCHATVESLAAAGQLPVWLAGHHKNAGSWFKAAGFSRTRSPGRLLLALLLAVAAAAAGFRLRNKMFWPFNLLSSGRLQQRRSRLE